MPKGQAKSPTEIARLNLIVGFLLDNDLASEIANMDNPTLEGIAKTLDWVLGERDSGIEEYLGQIWRVYDAAEDPRE